MARGRIDDIPMSSFAKLRIATFDAVFLLRQVDHCLLIVFAGRLFVDITESGIGLLYMQSNQILIVRNRPTKENAQPGMQPCG